MVDGHGDNSEATGKIKHGQTCCGHEKLSEEIYFNRLDDWQKRQEFQLKMKKD
jgi:hypothetical protein